MGFDPKDVFDVEDNALFRAQIQENYLRLRIFFKTLDVTESVQTAKYTVSLKILTIRYVAQKANKMCSDLHRVRRPRRWIEPLPGRGHHSAL